MTDWRLGLVSAWTMVGVGVAYAVTLGGGALCLAGVVGPLSGNMRLQFVGVAGYALGLPLACVLLARLFARRATTRPVDAADHFGRQKQ